MLEKLVTPQMVQVVDSGTLDWKQAIVKCAEPLLTNGNITERYIQAMIDVVVKNGPFINIGTGIALAHSRPENGVKKMGMSLMKVSKPINLVDANHPILLFICLAASDNETHLTALQELVNILGNDYSLHQLLNASKPEDILKNIGQRSRTK